MSTTQRVWLETIRALSLVHGKRTFESSAITGLSKAIEDIEKYYLLNGELVSSEKEILNPSAINLTETENASG